MKWPALLILIALAVTDVNAQVFVPTGHMTRARGGHSATLLQDGRVLIAGGGSPLAYGEASASTEIYDPDSETFTEIRSMTSPRASHSAVLLTDGRVLLAGGCAAPCSISAELYDPPTGTFSKTGNMSIAQAVHAAVLLRNGKVLVVGSLTIELFDPASGTFASLGKSQLTSFYGSSGYRATLLADATVLLTGDLDALIYHPATNQFHNVPLRLNFTGATSTPLLGGSVLFAGGFDPDSYPERAYSRSVLYDPVTQTFGIAAVMRQPRDSHTATLLRDGRVLLAGGNNGDGFDETTGILGSAEMYDPATAKFSQLASKMILHRDGHKATLLRDGRVLITGGRTARSNWQQVTDTLAELFVPQSYSGAVPQLSLDSTRFCAGDRWVLHADAVQPLSAVQISGTWNSTPWTIPNWTTSREDGTVEASGTFGADTVGDYWVWLHTGGNVSNTVAIRIEDCTAVFQR